ncbi:hypothetical protein NL676_034868 [Syzygium grande]|nr:hypothetical protein NL676_034868 [Syzygium grande]
MNFQSQNSELCHVWTHLAACVSQNATTPSPHPIVETMSQAEPIDANPKGEAPLIPDSPSSLKAANLNALSKALGTHEGEDRHKRVKLVPAVECMFGSKDQDKVKLVRRALSMFYPVKQVDLEQAQSSTLDPLTE